MQRKFFLFIVLFFVCLSNIIAQEFTAENPKKVYVFEITEPIAKPSWFNVQKAIKESKEKDVDLILLKLNTYGGQVDIADSIRTALLNSTIPIWVLIDNNAISAGALISIASDSIYMSKGANIGAATVVNQEGEIMPDKYQSFMRSMMRSTAEAKGRDPLIAEAMVDKDIYIPNVIDSGKVLTFTTTEAIANNFCEGQANSVEEIFELVGIEHYELIYQEHSPVEKTIRFLISPFISGLLIMIIIGGLYFELQTPGVGFPLIASISAAVLYFAPLYLEGLANNWEIIVFIIGVVLVAIEIFAFAGFGFFGISGIIMIISSLAFALVESEGFRIPTGDFRPLGRAFGLVLISVFLGIVSAFFLAKYMLQTQFLGHLALQTEENSSLGYVAGDINLNKLIGNEAITATILRPSGKIEINGEFYDAVAESSYIEKNTKVIIVKYHNMQLVVREI